MGEQLRERVLRRDSYTCQAKVRGYPHLCTGRLHVHHVVLRSQGGRDHPDDLLTVCSSAHHHIHNVDRTLAEEYGLIRRKGNYG
jgi:5-methylcytosine-specific restriction endonuclease McrA